MATSKVPTSQTYAVQVPKDVFAGEREFASQVKDNKPTILAVGTVAADGSTQADAAAIPDYPLVTVTAADATKGVILPPSGAGKVIKIHNVANAVLKVYPHSGGDINDGSANAAVSLAAKTAAEFACLDGATWSAIFTAG